MTVQIIEIAGQKMALLPASDYDRLLEVAEERDDVLAAKRAEERRLLNEEYVPYELVDAIIKGANPLREWRKYRGMSQFALAEICNCRLATISEIENGKAQGKPALWRALAGALNVTVDDILPDV